MMRRELNRKQYEKVRKMDHNQMTVYINGIYDDGYEKGVQDGKAQAESEKPEPGIPDLTGLDDFLQGIKGVGGAKARVVAEAVTVFLERKAAANETGA